MTASDPPTTSQGERNALVTFGDTKGSPKVESDDNIPFYNTHGESMGISSAGLIEVPAVPEHAAMEELGRGKRRRIPNPQYSGSFWVAN
ncbi:hypothetical protein M407DRAFT_143528 [Tulasnella calospora MUT 4182]|uniref:Uncharacterized protein n=1 Tax=Tulasnella calospora MUT 4182 TaxID=1051891 RepID=A0A0C3LEK2_9AGAM|nr:hypothetical protein M407DRAFT_143528 [Tulasnella calospora MUT 4182]